MSNLISRQDAIDAIQQRADKIDSVYSAFWEGLIIAQDIVKNIPSAEPERTVKVTDQTDHMVIYKASYFGVKGKCGCGYEVIADYKYCPMCGARLEWE